MKRIHPSVHIENTNYENDFIAYSNSVILNNTIKSQVSIGNESVIKNCLIGNNCAINRRNFVLNSKIGDFVYTGANTYIQTAEIGNFCSISWGVSIGGFNHLVNTASSFVQSRFRSLNRMEKKSVSSKKKYLYKNEIGHDVWIAAHAIINRGVKIGNGAVIGAGTVVTKDIEPYSVVVGVPAKETRKRFDENTIKTLEEIQWWYWPKEVIEKYQDLLFSEILDHNILTKMCKINKRINNI